MNKTSWDAFLEFEKDNKLFDFSDKNGIAVWDIIRHYIYSSTLSFDSSCDDSHSILSVRTVSKLKTIPLFLRWMISAHKNIFVFMCSRNLLGGRLVDQNLLGPLSVIGYDDCYLMESFNDPRDKRMAYPIKPSPSIIGVVSCFIKKNYDFSEIVSIIKRYYPKASISIEAIDGMYRTFYAQLLFYRCFFRLRHFKRIILTQNNFQKGMYFAAHQLGIPIYEIQHGYVSRAHMGYSYPREYEGLEKKVYCADKVLSMAPFWFKGVFNPVSTFVPIGNDYQAPTINRQAIEHKSFVVVSANVYGAALKELVYSVLKKECKFHFYFKLHPNEYSNYDDYCNFFKGDPRVDVISNQKTMQDLLKTAESVLLIQSTAAYEALYSGVKVFVYKRLSWEMNEDIADQKGVYFVDNADDLISMYESSRGDTLEPDSQYFMRFDKNAFLNAIEMN